MDNQQTPYLGMEPKHREKILNNTEKLVSSTDYKTLLTACYNEGLINRAMLNKIEAVSDRLEGEALQRERHRRLFRKLTKRGPEAFQKLKNILIKNNYNAAMKLLIEDENYTSINKGRNTPATANNNNNINNGIEVTDTPDSDLKDTSHTRAEGGCTSRIENNDEENENFILQPYDKEIKPKKAHEVRKSNQVHVGDETIAAYPMKSQHNRGVLFMVNIIDFVDKDDYRKGAKEDSESLLHLFKALGFTLFAYENLKSDEFKKRIDEVINSEYVRKAECFVMALMTHGTMDEHQRVEKVELSDGSVIKVKEILSRFNNDVCPNLLNKPKIFLFPFCRGVNHDLGRTNRIQADSIGVRKPSASADGLRVSDILICYATLPGFKAYRDIEDGSWYIQCFCENMAKHAHNTHFEDLLKMIQEDSGKQRSEFGAMQTANYNNMSFNKKLYFNPGVYEEMEAVI